MGKITVITPTIRPEGLDIVNIALKRQTFREFEWLIGSPSYPEFPDSRWVKDNFKGGVWTLNRACNKLVKKAKGELIVSWQDYTFADPDCLEKFWFHYQQEPTHLVSGVGNKYSSVYPELGELVWEDPRINQSNGSYYECYPVDWEANFAAAPKSSFYDVGGYDEYLDNYFSMDNVSIVERIDSLDKYKFFLDQTIKSYSLVHGRPKDWDKKHAMHGAYDERKQELKLSNRWPKLSYL
jgi:hypothetical protein